MYPTWWKRLLGYRQWIPTTSLVAAAILTTWIVRSFDPEVTSPTAFPDEDPDYFVENFTTTVTDPTGNIKRQLSAARLLHFPETDTNELTAPHLILYRASGTPWHVKSERGWVSASGEIILLLGRVHAWRDDDRGIRVVDIHTRDLRILQSADYGETDKSVVIRSRGSETRGIAMRAFLKDSRIELLSEVTTIYQKRSDQQ